MTAQTESISDELSWMEPFSVSALEDKTFRVIWTATSRVPRKTKAGGVYEAPCIVADIKGYLMPIKVVVPQSDYDKLRLMGQVQGIKAFSCSVVPAKDGNKYGTRIYTGASEW